MATLATLAVKLVADAAGFKTELGTAEKSAESFQDKVGKLGLKLGAVGAGMTAGATAPIMAFFGDAIDKASDLSETTSKVTVVFGKNAADMLKWGENAATAFGMPTEKALAFAGTFGNLFSAMGMAPEKSAEMSKSLVQLASDLGSFNNMEAGEVLEKLKSGLTGETDGLKALGVNLNAAAIEAEAMAMGLIKNAKEMTPAIKAQATYSAILKQTTLAQGDFAKTSDGLANSTKIANAQFENATTQLGTHLLPIKLALVSAISKILAGFNGLSPEMQKIVVVVLAIVAAIGPLLGGLGSVLAAVSALAPVFAGIAAVVTGPVLLMVAIVVGALALLYYAWTNNLGGIRDTVMLHVTALQLGFAAIVAFVTRHMGEIRAVIDAAVKFISAAFTLGKTIIVGIWTAFMQLLNGDTKGALETLKLTFTNAWAAVQLMVTNAKTAFLNTLALLLDGSVANARDKLGQVKQQFISKLGEAIEYVEGLPGRMAAAGVAMIAGIVRGIQNSGASVLNALGGVVDAAIEAIKRRLGIASPSKLFATFGGYMMTGWADGIEGKGWQPARALADVATGMFAGGPGLTLAAGAGAGAGALAGGGGETHLHFHDVHVRDERDIDAIAAAVAARFNRRS